MPFKTLVCIPEFCDWEPNELWAGIRDFIKKECKGTITVFERGGKHLSDEAPETVNNREEVKAKGERSRYLMQPFISKKWERTTLNNGCFFPTFILLSSAFNPVFRTISSTHRLN